MAARRAIVNAEEEELRAALEAVANAERREQEEREREERRLQRETQEAERARIAEEEARVAAEMEQLQRMEAARVERISGYYESLRSTIKDLHRLQRKKITERHKMEVEKSIQDLEENTAKKEELEIAEAESHLERHDRVERARESHAQAVVQTFARHRTDQNRLFDSISREEEVAQSRGGAALNVTAKATRVEELMALQEHERAVLREQQQRELRKLQIRASQMYFQSQEHAERTLVLQEEKQRLTEEARGITQQADADMKWFDLIVVERQKMLNEDERRLVHSGGDAPDVPTCTIVATKDGRLALPNAAMQGRNSLHPEDGQKGELPAVRVHEPLPN